MVKRLDHTDEIFSNASFNAAHYGVPQFDNCTFEHCAFSAAHIEGADFFCCSMTETSFDNVVIYWGMFSSHKFKACKFKDVIFAGVSLNNVMFEACTFHNMTFRPGNMGGGCRFENVEFKNCTFSRTVSINSDLCSETDLPHGVAVKHVKKSELTLVMGLPVSEPKTSA